MKAGHATTSRVSEHQLFVRLTTVSITRRVETTQASLCVLPLSYPFTPMDGEIWSLLITRAVLRLECSLDCISGSVGYQQNIFIFSLSAFLLKLKKCNYKKCNWVSGSPSILYKLVLSPVPIVHTNFQENLLMSYSWCPQLSR